MARARSSVSQCARPVGLVKAEGTASSCAPGGAQVPVELRKAHVVAHREPEPADRGVDEDGVARRVRRAPTRGSSRRARGCRRRTGGSCRSAPRGGRRRRRRARRPPRDRRLPARSGMVPPTIHSFSRCAVAARKSCAGPLPSLSATLRLSASFSPMKEKFSGSAASCAPRAAAASSSTRACSRFSATSGPEVICSAATLIIGASVLSPGAHSAGITMGSFQVPRKRSAARAFSAAAPVNHSRSDSHRAATLGVGPKRRTAEGRRCSPRRMNAWPS